MRPKTDDVSGRGLAGDFKVPFPGVMYRYTEDCAQAPGAEYKGRKVGSIGDFGCFSFHGAKNTLKNII